MGTVSFLRPDRLTRGKGTGLLDDLRATFTQINDQINSATQLRPRLNRNGVRPNRLRGGDSTTGRRVGTKDLYLGVADDTGKLNELPIRQSLTQYQDPDSASGAPAVANFPVSGDYGWYKDTATGFVYWSWNDSGTLRPINLQTLAGTLTDELHGALGRKIAAGTAHHSNASTSEPGFMSDTDKTKLNAATDAATASAIVRRDASAGASFAALTASSYNLGANLIINARYNVTAPAVSGDVGPTYVADTVTKINECIHLANDLRAGVLALGGLFF